MAAWLAMCLAGLLEYTWGALNGSLAAVHGWSCAQTDPEVKAVMQAALRGFRERCVPIVKQWQDDGVVAATAEPDAVAQLILSISVGFVAQRSLTGDADVQAHADALTALTRAPAG